jgi:peroxiredoxin
MLVKKEAVCFGYRSQRYSMVVDNGRVEMIFCEDGKEDNFAGDPFQVSDAESMLEYLSNVKDLRRSQLGITDEETADTVSE